ncbi:MAG: Hsp20/alpha crystallin family protein [Candidatus Bathyarchaeia archaeon]
MKWRRSEKPPKWFKAVRRIEEAENKRKKSLRFVRIEDYKAKGSPYRRVAKKLEFKGKAYREPEPLLDVFNEKNSIAVVAELKGFNRENIKLNIVGQRLTLSARAQNRRFYKRLNLPEEVIPETAFTTYKNGVLEIKLEKAVKENVISKWLVRKDAS